MQTKQFTTPSAAEGRRLDVVLLELLGDDFSRSQVQRLIKDGLAEVDGQPGRASQKVAAGQALAVRIPPAEPVDLRPEPMDLRVLYEDEHLIVVNKAPGVVVHPSPGHGRATLVHGLLHHCGGLAEVGGKLRPGIVHRLDKDTSGALVAAKSDRAHRGLVAAFAAGAVSKQYLALVHGQPPATGVSRQGIGRHPVDRKRMSSRARHAKPALSRWRVVSRWAAGAALVRVEIKTGRTHQIRVHLSEAGFPVAGDAVYGGRVARRGLPGQAGAELKRAGRQMLHAAVLAFAHPVTGQPVEALAPLPDDFRDVLRALISQGRAV